MIVRSALGFLLLFLAAGRLCAAAPGAQDAAPKAPEYHGILQRWTAAYLDFLFSEIRAGVQTLASADPQAQSATSGIPPQPPISPAAGSNPLERWIAAFAGKALADMGSGIVEMASTGPVPQRAPVDLSDVSPLPGTGPAPDPEEDSEEVGPLTREKFGEGFNEERAPEILREMGKGKEAEVDAPPGVPLKGMRKRNGKARRPVLRRLPVYSTLGIRPARFEGTRVRSVRVRSSFDSWPYPYSSYTPEP